MISNKDFKTIIKISIWLVAIIFFVGLFALLPKIFSSHELLFQIIAVVLSVLFTAVVTNNLLNSQSQGEENKEKNIKIHENKIRAYSRFMRNVWGILDDDIISQEEIKSLRSELFNSIIFYLDKSKISEIRCIVNAFSEGIKNKNAEEGLQGDMSKLYRSFAVSITTCLKGDIEGASKNTIIKFWRRKDKPQPQKGGFEGENENAKKSKDTPQDQDSDPILSIWQDLELISSKYPSDSEVKADNQTIAKDESTDIDISNKQNAARHLNMQAWHFCELGTEQLDKLDQNFNELSCVEYSEYWRTKLVKQVKSGDLIFLFRGAKKYAGAFIAKGWRVFEYDTNGYVSETTSDGIAPVLPLGKVKIDEYTQTLEEHDFYYSFGDGATSCANIVVERLSYIRDGVDNPNTTYRRTISRYYEGYAVKLLEEFINKETNKEAKAEMEKLFV